MKARIKLEFVSFMVQNHKYKTIGSFLSFYQMSNQIVCKFEIVLRNRSRFPERPAYTISVRDVAYWLLTPLAAGNIPIPGKCSFEILIANKSQRSIHESFNSCKREISRWNELAVQ